MNILGLHIGQRMPVFVERRRAERIHTDQNLFVDYRSPVHLTSGSGEARDISATGIRFACYSHYPIGTPLDMNLRYLCGNLGEKMVRVHGYVVRCYRRPIQRRFRVACAFNRFDESSEQQIREFVGSIKTQNSNQFYS